MLNEEQLLKDIRDAKYAIKKTLEDLSIKYPSHEFDMASTKYKYHSVGLDDAYMYMVDISCYLKKDFKC